MMLNEHSILAQLSYIVVIYYTTNKCFTPMNIFNYLTVFQPTGVPPPGTNDLLKDLISLDNLHTTTSAPMENEEDDEGSGSGNLMSMDKILSDLIQPLSQDYISNLFNSLLDLGNIRNVPQPAASAIRPIRPFAASGAADVLSGAIPAIAANSEILGGETAAEAGAITLVDLMPYLEGFFLGGLLGAQPGMYNYGNMAGKYPSYGSLYDSRNERK